MPQALTASNVVFDLHLDPRSRATIFFSVACVPEAAMPRRPKAAFLAAYVQTKRCLRASTARAAMISSRHEEFDETMRRSANDMRMLVTEKPTGPYPYAGIPWFSTQGNRVNCPGRASYAA